MAKIISYQRPESLEAALNLISQEKHIPLAGGTLLNAGDDVEPLHLVDLQGLDLKRIEEAEGRLQIGSMVTLDEIIKNTNCPESIRISARSELPSTLRALATIGGTVASADSDSQLLACLLVHDADVVILGPNGESTSPISDVLGNLEIFNSQLILSISVATDGKCVFESTGRTPADTPIVSVTTRKCADGYRMAITGVATTPVLVDHENPTLSLKPPSDFRGSSKYRMQLAEVLSSRTLNSMDGEN